MTKKGKILITGAAGFIGSHICERMLLEDYKIVGIDNLNDYYDPELKKNNLKILKKFDNFDFQKIDVRNYNDLHSVFKNHSFKSIIHLAAQAGVRYSIQNPFIYQQTNVRGTLNLLDLTRQFNCENFVFGSSSSVYGNQEKVPFSEKDPITQPISIYAATKQAGEALCFTYHHLYDLNVKCLRFFTVYGPRGRPDMSPHIFTQKILKGEKIEIFDNAPGMIKRDFTFISDIVEGLLSAYKFKDGFHIFNLGYGLPIKMVDFVAILEELIGKKADIKFSGCQPGDVDITYANISKAKKLLKFQPKIAIKQGIEKFLNWFEEYYY